MIILCYLFTVGDYPIIYHVVKLGPIYSLFGVCLHCLSYTPREKEAGPHTHRDRAHTHTHTYHTYAYSYVFGNCQRAQL